MKLGCDPEIFLVDAFGALKSSIGLIGGSKEDPRPLPIGDGYAVQEDNVAIEFNIPPADSEDAFNEFIANALTFLSKEVKDRYGFEFSHRSAASFPKEELNVPEAFIFGCDPDYNAWTGRKNPRPRANDKALRSCGGHVHVGMPMSEEETWKMGRLMDLFLGVPSVVLDDGSLRKQLYGKRGAMRVKPYGMEYRTLSNFWVFEERLRRWVFQATNKAKEALEQNYNVEKWDKYIYAAIDGNSREYAEHLIKTLNLHMPQV